MVINHAVPPGDQMDSLWGKRQGLGTICRTLYSTAPPGDQPHSATLSANGKLVMKEVAPPPPFGLDLSAECIMVIHLTWSRARQTSRSAGRWCSGRQTASWRNPRRLWRRRCCCHWGWWSGWGMGCTACLQHQQRFAMGITQQGSAHDVRRLCICNANTSPWASGQRQTLRQTGATVTRTAGKPCKVRYMVADAWTDDTNIQWDGRQEWCQDCWWKHRRTDTGSDYANRQTTCMTVTGTAGHRAPVKYTR